MGLPGGFQGRERITIKCRASAWNLLNTLALTLGIPPTWLASDQLWISPAPSSARRGLKEMGKRTPVHEISGLRELRSCSDRGGGGERSTKCPESGGQRGRQGHCLEVADGGQTIRPSPSHVHVHAAYTHTHTHPFTHTCTHSYTVSHTLNTHTCACTLTHTHTPLTHSHTGSHTLSFTHIHSHTHNTHMLILAYSHTHIPSHSHTHTDTHRHTRTHTCAHEPEPRRDGIPADTYPQ